MLLAALDPGPLLVVGLGVDLVGGQLGRLLVLDLLGEDEVEDEGHEGGDGEAGLEDELDGVVEAEEGAVVARVGEYVAEPSGFGGVRC